MRRAGAARIAIGVVLVWLAASSASRAQDKGAADLAQQLSNPVASLISVPFQFNYDWRIGPERGGEKFYLNFQPVVPIPLDKDWNLISRTILLKIGDQPISIGAGVRYWAESPTTGAHDFGARAVVTFLFPTQQKRWRS